MVLDVYGYFRVLEIKKKHFVIHLKKDCVVYLSKVGMEN